MELGYDDYSSKSYVIDNQQPKENHERIIIRTGTEEITR